MWKISYLDLASDGIFLKGGFSSDKDAIEWAEEQENSKKIIALNF